MRLAYQFGMKKRRRLKPRTVPTVFHKPSMAQVVTSEAGERSSHERTADACSMVGD